MEIVIGLLIIAIGSFCQSSSYVPIKKVKDWSWESFWLVQGIFAWLIFPVLGAQLAVPEGQSLVGLYLDNLSRSMWPVFWGILWGVGGLTFGLSMPVFSENRAATPLSSILMRKSSLSDSVIGIFSIFFCLFNQ